MRSSARLSEPLALRDVPSFRDTIVKRSIKDQVADKIAGLIASGILQIGDALPGERELAAALNVSRETVRGAIQILALRGVLEVSQGARTRVVRAEVGRIAIGFATARAIDAYDLDAVHAARILVERQIVGEAAQRIDAATLATLDRLIAAQESALDDPVRFLISDREFHLTIYGAAANPLLGDFATDLYAYMMERRRVVVAGPGAILRSTQDHRAILEAFRRHDAEAAVAAFAVHTERIYETTRSVLEVRPASA
ncbi:FadR/GntR family transcriptional regulator [Lichenifustis flavocetrariae]|uniref:FCD domain-containing protein n=1 Tax=Lichenifustis flavocetrariae TaxID=2949735 RepID=A0AA42CMQ0_9HYPH|nr:FCD domain-containing protein [Lichenifustis flavocetrariae]MCW6508585.1 FCD domain-containing protein [Lichenifustis flavocetrariae]